MLNYHSGYTWNPLATGWTWSGHQLGGKPLTTISPFSTFPAVSLCGVEGLAETFPWFPAVSVAHFSLMFQAFWSLLTLSFHSNFGLPLGRFPSIFISATARMFSVSTLLLTCANYSSLLLLMTIAMGSTFAPHFSCVLTGSPSWSFAQFSSLLLPPVVTKLVSLFIFYCSFWPINYYNDAMVMHCIKN